MMLNRDYSKILLKIRAKLNLSQEELAEKLGVVFATINRWENGRAVPTKMHIVKIEEMCKSLKIVI